MTTYADEVARAYWAKGVFVDTNLLLLLMVGRTDPTLIARHKRLQVYDADDFETLDNYVTKFARIVTTPFVMAETDDFVGRGDDWRQAVAAQLSGFAVAAQEDYVPSERGFIDPASARFGLVDAIVKLVVARGVLLVSDDYRLVSYLAGHGIAAVNFNHIRPI